MVQVIFVPQFRMEQDLRNWVASLSAKQLDAMYATFAPNSQQEEDYQAAIFDQAWNTNHNPE